MPFLYANNEIIELGSAQMGRVVGWCTYRRRYGRQYLVYLSELRHKNGSLNLSAGIVGLGITHEAAIQSLNNNASKKGRKVHTCPNREKMNEESSEEGNNGRAK